MAASKCRPARAQAPRALVLLAGVFLTAEALAPARAPELNLRQTRDRRRLTDDRDQEARLVFARDGICLIEDFFDPVAFVDMRRAARDGELRLRPEMQESVRRRRRRGGSRRRRGARRGYSEGTERAERN